MEEKNQDKYQEPTEGEKEPAASEEKPQLENEIPVPKAENVLESEEKSTEEKKEVAEEKKIETEPAKEVEPVKEEPKAEEAIKEEAAPAPAPVPPSAQAQKQVKQLKDLDRPSQVKALCDLAFQKGLAFAIEVAKTLDNAYVLDEFHDTLVDELRKKLVEEGKLKQI